MLRSFALVLFFPPLSSSLPLFVHHSSSSSSSSSSSHNIPYTPKTRIRNTPFDTVQLRFHFSKPDETVFLPLLPFFPFRKTPTNANGVLKVQGHPRDFVHGLPQVPRGDAVSPLRVLLYRSLLPLREGRLSRHGHEAQQRCLNLVVHLGSVFPIQEGYPYSQLRCLLSQHVLEPWSLFFML